MFFILLILIDQATKYLIRFFGGFYICNPDISFSIRIPLAIFWLLWILLIILLIHYYNVLRKSETAMANLGIIGITLLLSGAVSNAIDRLWGGCVVDFIDLKIWPIFNLADIFISIGAIIIAIYLFNNKHP